MLEYIVDENMDQYINRKDILSYIEKIKLIEKLLKIKKDELDERDFYEEVLTVIADMGTELTPELATLLKHTLKEIGCVTYKEWKIEKEKAGEIIEEVFRSN